MKILIKTVGFIGDILFASSIAQKLHDECVSFLEVDYLIGLPQPLELLYNNPYINKVYLNSNDVLESKYDKIYNLQPINRLSTPCEQFQLQCEINNPTPDYKIYTNPGLDLWAKSILENDIRSSKKIIAILENWEERSFLFTEEEYIKGIDVPNFGYGGKHRDIEYIKSELASYEELVLIPVGKPNGKSSNQTISHGCVSEYSWTASILKNCDYFIGAEGGLANLAAGVGTKTIITGDFIHQLYGWNGCIEKCKEPKLGPKHYFLAGHVTLNPYLTDKQVVEDILNIIL